MNNKIEKLEAQLNVLKQQTEECQNEILLQKVIDGLTSFQLKNNLLDEVQYFESDLLTTGKVVERRGIILFKLNGKENKVVFDFHPEEREKNVSEIVIKSITNELIRVLKNEIIWKQMT